MTIFSRLLGAGFGAVVLASHRVKRFLRVCRLLTSSQPTQLPRPALADAALYAARMEGNGGGSELVSPDFLFGSRTKLHFCLRLSSLLPLSSDPRCSHAYLFSLLLRLFPLATRSFVCGSATAVTYHSHPFPLNLFTPSSFGFLFPWIDPLPLFFFHPTTYYAYTQRHSQC